MIRTGNFTEGPILSPNVNKISNRKSRGVRKRADTPAEFLKRKWFFEKWYAKGAGQETRDQRMGNMRYTAR